MQQMPWLFGHPSGIRRKRRLRRAQLNTILLGAVALGACSRDARAVRLPALQGDAEFYRITCGAGIEVCREKAREVCAGGYAVLETAGAPIETPRITTAPGPRTTGPRYERAKWLGHMVVECTRAEPAADALVTRPGAPVSPNVEGSSAAPSPNQLCIPGATVECLGAGACRGAQACLMDGRGYGLCDCGASSPRAGEAAHNSTDASRHDAGLLGP